MVLTAMNAAALDPRWGGRPVNCPEVASTGIRALLEHRVIQIAARRDNETRGSEPALSRLRTMSAER